MANPSRGEVEYIFTTYDAKGEAQSRHFTFKFSNAGKIATENMLGMESAEIMQKLDAPGARIITALFFGATRKYHARDFPNPAMVHKFMDDLEEAKEDLEREQAQELELELLASLFAAFLRTDKEQFKKIFRGEEIEPNEDAVPKAELAAVGTGSRKGQEDSEPGTNS